MCFNSFKRGSLVEKYGISRSDIVLGRILGAGFFGEVHEGVYKSDVSSSIQLREQFLLLLVRHSRRSPVNK